MSGGGHHTPHSLEGMLADLAKRGHVTITSLNGGRRWIVTLMTAPGAAGHVTWEGKDLAAVVAAAHAGAVGGVVP